MSSLTAIYSLIKHVRGDTPWDVEVNGDLDSIDQELARERVPFLTPTVGATTTLDLNQSTGARVFAFTVSQATTLAFSNVPSSSFACEVFLFITNGSAFVLTFPGSVTWAQGVSPTLQTAGIDFVRMWTRDGGTTWYAVHLGKNLSIGGSLRGILGTGTSQGRVSQILAQFNSLTTTSGAEVSLGTYSLVGNSLNVNAQMIRATLSGIAPVGGMAYNLKFGATSVSGGAVSVGASRAWRATIEIVRTGAATQLSDGICFDSQPQVASLPRSSPAETLSGAVTIDIRANATVGGQTATVEQVLLEYLAA